MSARPAPDHPRFAPVADGGLLVGFGETFSDGTHRGVLAQDRALARDIPAVAAAAQVIGFLDSGLMPVVDGAPPPLVAQLICIHGDTSAGIGEAVPANASLPVILDPVVTDHQAMGRLVPHDQPGSMIHDPRVAAARVIGFLDNGPMPIVDGALVPLAARSICFHGDSPGAVAMARHIRDRLQAGGVALQPFLRR